MKSSKSLYVAWMYIVSMIVNTARASLMIDPTNLSDGEASFSIPLEAYANNKAFGEFGNFDGMNNYFKKSLPDEQWKQLINYSFVNENKTTLDNIQLTQEQTVTIDLSKYDDMPLGALYMLASTSHGPVTTNVIIVYSDETEDATTVSLPDWQDGMVDQMERYQAIRYSLSISGRLGSLFSVPIYVNPHKKPLRIVFPPLMKGEAALHIFAIQAYKSQAKIIITSAQSTQEVANAGDQLILLRLHNLGTTWVRSLRAIEQTTEKSFKKISLDSSKAVPPGHSSIVYVNLGQTNSSEASVSLEYVDDEGTMVTTDKVQVPLFEIPTRFEQSLMSVRNHRSPSWLKKAKFGIFIHWGLYSVPAWAPMGESYAEWYWWNYNQKNSSTFDYHHQHFGEQFEYDQFLNLWKPTNFNPDLWLELIDKSGARYYVFTAKHHDGIALFDTGVTKRSTVHLLNVSYDFVNELMRKSKADYPHLKRGLYFSLPEWYHPSYRDESLGWHGPPRNPYTGAVTNYSGSKTINDFVNELQVPQLMELTEMHDPDILWCDIGGIHNSSVWQAQYFNQAMAKNKQVAVNDRCGDGSASDFTTIEYKSIIDMPTRFWEATRGMDPYSFGYNRATKPEEYASSEELIQTLIDTVAYGGNFLLNIGPDDSGTVPDVMVGRLVDIGNWLHMVDSAIFNTIPYWIRAKEDEHLRFTASEDGTTVYVFYLRSTNDVQQRQQVIKIRTPLPIISKGGATIRLLNDRNVTIYWNYSTKGDLELHYTNSNLVNTTYALIFEVKYF